MTGGGCDPRSWSPCQLCPRRCGVDRTAGQVGYCGSGDRLRIFRSGPHAGEEPPISGERGSGTIFFSRCTLRCCYCQNHPWSQEGQGTEWTGADLVRELIRLRDTGCHNWNLVSPTPWLPAILPALEQARASGAIPVVYNTSGYERPEVVAALGNAVSIYLTDLRYARPATAGMASDAVDYVDISRGALKAMWRAAGPLEMDAAGLARRGVICRVLILPGHAEEAIESLEWMAREIGTGLAISLMAQYTPAYRARALQPWNRGITMQEYLKVTEAMEALGFSLGWVQEFGGPPPDGLLGHTMPAGPAALAAPGT